MPKSSIDQKAFFLPVETHVQRYGFCLVNETTITFSMEGRWNPPESTLWTRPRIRNLNRSRKKDRSWRKCWSAACKEPDRSDKIWPRPVSKTIWIILEIFRLRWILRESSTGTSRTCQRENRRSLFCREKYWQSQSNWINLPFPRRALAFFH